MTWTHRPLPILTVTSGFGSDFGGPNTARPRHNGVDFRARTPLDLRAPLGGRVVLADRAGGDPSDEEDAGGLEVVIEHDDGTRSGYAHLSAVFVAVGDRVEAGQVFAKTGNTGGVVAHLHMTARDASGKRVDPQTLIPRSSPLGPLLVVLLVAGLAAYTLSQGGLA